MSARSPHGARVVARALPRPIAPLHGRALAVGSITLAAACSGGGTEPTPRDALTFAVQPGTVEAGGVISPSPRVELRTASGQLVPGSPEITVLLGRNPGGATLSGATTVRAVSGVATFPDLRIDRPGLPYTLVAVTEDAESATSEEFEVTLDFAAISAGFWTTCGLTTLGLAYCWGHNDEGAVGNGASGPIVPRPVPVSGGRSYTRIDVGFEFTCAVTPSLTADCWGRNAAGQLGDGSTMTRTSPTPVAGALDLSLVAAGSDHACGRTADGIAHCWGGNWHGALGDGTRGEGSSTPQPVVGGPAFAVLSAGEFHTCGLTGEGAAYCWGRSVSPDPDSVFVFATAPELVGGGHTFEQLSAGHYHTCAISAEDGGILYCWGVNDRGQLGDGSGVSQVAPVAVGGALRFAAVGAGGQHTCAITVDGAAYCWGWNFYAQLGTGGQTDSATPVAVTGSRSYTAMASGAYYSCALAADGVWCWGFNSGGQLGTASSERLLTTPGRVRF